MSNPDPVVQSKASGGPHHQLALMAGRWSGVTRTWFEPGELSDESPSQGTMRLVMGGRFLLWEYHGSLDGEPIQGLALIGYDVTASRFEMAWADTWHMGSAVMFCQGPTRGERPEVLGFYPDPGGGPDWGWRTEFVLESPDRLTITATNISPEGQEARAIETVYTRQL